MKVLVALSIFAVLLITPLVAAGSANPDALHVSIVRLIASPDSFEGKIVRIEGYLHLQFEGQAIYLHKQDYDRALTKNGLWVDAPVEMLRQMAKMNDRYVLIDGVFSSKDEGHMGLWSGAVTNITRAAVLPKFHR
jgi:hypothetical protein